MHAKCLFGALSNPVITLRGSVLAIGMLQLNANIFPALCSAKRPADIVEQIPIMVQKQWITAVMSEERLRSNELAYYMHSELAECRVVRPYYSLWTDRNTVPFVWAQAAFGRDSGAVGQMVADVFWMIDAADMASTAQFAASPPNCHLLHTLLRLSGASPETSTDLDIICALCIAVRRYEGQLACAYILASDATTQAIATLRQKCLPSQLRSLGLLSPLPSSQL